MGEIVTLRDGQDLRDWKCTFVVVVVSLCPDINPDAADEASDTEFCLEIDPSLAASMWVEQQGRRHRRTPLLLPRGVPRL